MTALTWDKVGDRVYETGLDRGVLYFPEGGGVPWNGLVAIEEQVSTSVQAVHFDGLKTNDIVTVGDFSAVIRAYTYPNEFLRFEGTLEDQAGILVTGQPPEVFHMSYRTRVGNDISSEMGYKIHLLYNLTAIPADIERATLSLDVEPNEFEWEVTSIPEYIEGFRPTSHVIIDTRRIDPLLVSDIEDILYGSEEAPPILPSLRSLTTFVRKWGRLVVIDNGDGTWTATTNEPGVLEMLDETTFQITADTAVYLDADTYTLESSARNEEDIWPQ